MTSLRQTSLLKETRIIYCADSSTFIDLNRRGHPIDTFPTLWGNIDMLIDNGRIIAPKESLRELAVGDDQLFRWAKARKKLFIAPDEAHQDALRQIMSKFPNCIKTGTTGVFADPWVVALAVVNECTVLTYEKSEPNNPNSNKIPDICNAFGVKCMHPFDMMRVEGWKF